MTFMPHRVSLLVLGVLCTAGAAGAGEAEALNSRMHKYLDERKAEFDQIPAERKALLEKLAGYVRHHTAAGRPARLTFICTHNSRRSHMAQLFAAAAAAYYGVGHVETFSGGTEATAFNPRAVTALKRAGFEIEPGPEKANPRYQVHLAPAGMPLVCFSKVYSDDPNPKADYCAVMTCSQADKHCPVVHGASLRLAVTYEDPKAADGTPQETATYDARCAQIAREMLYVFARVKG